MQHEQVPEAIKRSAEVVAGILARFQAAVDDESALDLTITGELSIAAQELGSTYRACHLGPEKAIVHFRHMLGYREDGTLSSRRRQRWVGNSVLWILDGYYAGARPDAETVARVVAAADAPIERVDPTPDR